MGAAFLFETVGPDFKVEAENVWGELPAIILYMLANIARIEACARALKAIRVADDASAIARTPLKIMRNSIRKYRAAPPSVLHSGTPSGNFSTDASVGENLASLHFNREQAMRRRNSHKLRSQYVSARVVQRGVLSLLFSILCTSVSYGSDASPLPGAWRTKQVHKSMFTGTFVRAVPKSDDPTDPGKITSYAQLLPFVDQPMVETYLNGWYGWRNPLPGNTKTDTVQNCLEDKDIRSNADEALLFLQAYQTAEFSCLPEKGNSPQLGRVRMICTPPVAIEEFVHNPLKHLTHLHLSWTREVRSPSFTRIKESTRAEVMGLSLETSTDLSSTRLGACEDFPEAKKIPGSP